MEPARRLVVTEAMYLAMEKASDVKHEYHAGEVWAMAGASPRHNRLALACSTQLDSALRVGPCLTLNSDQRLHVPATGDYCYPDVTVVRGDPAYHSEDPDSITNPRLIVEVLSRSSERHDRGTKFEEYRSMPSFQEYVLIWQDRIKVEIRRRESERRWSIEELGAGEQIELTSIGTTLDVDALYERAFLLKGDAPPQRELDGE